MIAHEFPMISDDFLRFMGREHFLFYTLKLVFHDSPDRCRTVTRLLNDVFPKYSFYKRAPMGLQWGETGEHNLGVCLVFISFLIICYGIFGFNYSKMAN